uniref:Transcriptional regulator, GntR family n=1 Tax=uncultured Thiotrichaceae bacterium TaxID=298394 RepID=A0A6S6UEA6_9GAMM|nr:MAG: Transcriptional regulator, GntR family [uncultured Thiotrichaceae bacterium]
MTDVSSTKKKSRDTEIYGQVFDALLEQKLAPGTRLSEDKLGQVFGVSRTIIRKVLQRLEHEGVVEIHRNRGAIVANTSNEQVKQTFDARRIIELAVVQQACQTLTPAHAEQLRLIINEEQQARAEGDEGRALRLSGEWHLVLAKHCGNEFLARFARSLVSRCSLIIAQYESAESVAHKLCPRDEHTDILNAIIDKDAETATRLMHDHIQHIEDKIEIRSNKKEPDLAQIFGEG